MDFSKLSSTENMHKQVRKLTARSAAIGKLLDRLVTLANFFVQEIDEMVPELAKNEGPTPSTIITHSGDFEHLSRRPTYKKAILRLKVGEDKAYNGLEMLGDVAAYELVAMLRPFEKQAVQLARVIATRQASAATQQLLVSAATFVEKNGTQGMQNYLRFVIADTARKLKQKAVTEKKRDIRAST